VPKCSDSSIHLTRTRIPAWWSFTPLAGLYNVKGERMRIVRLVKLFVFLGALVLMTVPCVAEAA